MRLATTAAGFGPVPRRLWIPILLNAGFLTGLGPGIPAEGAKHHVTVVEHARNKHKRIPVHDKSPLAAVTPPLPPAGAGGAVASPAPVAAAVPAAPEPSIEEQIFALTNQARQANDLVALELDPELTQAAQIQATAMALLDVQDHDLPGMPQPTLASRLQFVGYRYSWAGENIAYGVLDAPSVVALWLNSPPHEQNIMSPIAVATGVAVASDSQGVLYFCQVFGEPW
jgi:uncharacterized protein YkwD